MRRAALQLAAGAVWLVWVSAAGLAGDVNSPGGWTLLAAVGALPPLVLLLQWKISGQPLSEAVQKRPE
jgi:hypothetical protein